MTGWECVEEALRARGYHPSKILGNKDFIEAIITILSDEGTRQKIDLATANLSKAKAEAEVARQREQDAVRRYNAANRKLDEAKELMEETATRIKELESLRACETAEARDKIRLLAAFKECTPCIKALDGKSETAYIYCVGSILAGGALFADVSKEANNDKP